MQRTTEALQDQIANTPGYGLLLVQDEAKGLLDTWCQDGKKRDMQDMRLLAEGRMPAKMTRTVRNASRNIKPCAMMLPPGSNNASCLRHFAQSRHNRAT